MEIQSISAIASVLTLAIIAFFWYRAQAVQPEEATYPASHLLKRFRTQVWVSSSVLLVVVAAWSSLHSTPNLWHPLISDRIGYRLLLDSANILLLIAIYGVIASLINTAFAYIANYDDNRLVNVILPFGRLFKIAVVIILFNEACALLDIPPRWIAAIHQLNQVAIISAAGWAAFQCIQMGELFFIQHNRDHLQDSLSARGAYTHIAIIKRILIVLLSVIIIAAILMTFDRVRSVGGAIFASAGISGIVIGFSARGLLESLFHGLQLAISQPIRMNDTVTINGETGTITAINLHYVVVTLIDGAQVIVPSGDFLTRTFKNWTRCSLNLSGHIMVYVKYDTQIEEVRRKFHEILQENTLWDKKIGELLVNDLKSGIIELKLNVSAKDGIDLAKLKDTVREQLLTYLQTEQTKDLP